MNEEIWLRLYQINVQTVSVVPASRHRDWQKANPYSFKCRPMNNANCLGWDLLTSDDVVISWNSETSMHDVTSNNTKVCISNFGHGTITFLTGYTFHTTPGWGLLVSPIPNYNHNKFVPYSALIETDELKYPLFITCKINRPGGYYLPKGTPICRIIPIKLEPTIKCNISIETEPDDFMEYRLWQAKERKQFQSTEEFQSVKNSCPYQSEKLGWQKFYDRIAKFPLFKSKSITNK